jgi:SET domain-containing protein
MPWTEFSVILKPSTVSGIGVFAIHAIPAGTQVFVGKFSPRKMEIKSIPPELIKYCIFLNDKECLCPERFDRMEIGWYINHSDKPNISKTSEGHIVSIRNIKADEEILIDYNQLNEPEHLKEPYYKVPTLS